jgi:hypothetical protein
MTQNEEIVDNRWKHQSTISIGGSKKKRTSLSNMIRLAKGSYSMVSSNFSSVPLVLK